MSDVVGTCNQQGATICRRGLFGRPIEEEALWVQFVLAETLLLAEVADKYLVLCYWKTNFC